MISPEARAAAQAALTPRRRALAKQLVVDLDAWLARWCVDHDLDPNMNKEEDPRIVGALIYHALTECLTFVAAKQNMSAANFTALMTVAYEDAQKQVALEEARAVVLLRALGLTS